jgi:hypothetical protein
LRIHSFDRVVDPDLPVFPGAQDQPAAKLLVEISHLQRKVFDRVFKIFIGNLTFIDDKRKTCNAGQVSFELNTDSKLFVIVIQF